MLAESADDTRGDTLIAVGVSKGTRRILTVPLRGKGNSAKTRNLEDQGISEAFNKHVVYAGIVSDDGTPATVIGNILYKTSCSAPAGTEWSQTLIVPEYFAPPTPSSSPAVIVDPGVPQPGHTLEFKDADDAAPYDPALGCDPLPAGITYTNGGGEFYDINADVGATEVLQFEPFGAGTLDVNIKASIDDKVVADGGRILINGSYTIGSASAGTPVLWATGDIIIPVSAPAPTINGDIYTGGSQLQVGSTGGHYNGYLKSAGTISVNSGNTIGSSGSGNATGLIAAGAITLNGCTIYGTVSSGTGITLNVTAATINATDVVSLDTAVLLVSSSGPAAVTVSGAPDITLGANQNAAIGVFSSGGDATVDVNAVLNPTYNSSVSQSAIIAYTFGVGCKSVVNLAGLTSALPVNAGQSTLMVLTAPIRKLN